MILALSGCRRDAPTDIAEGAPQRLEGDPHAAEDDTASDDAEEQARENPDGSGAPADEQTDDERNAQNAEIDAAFLGSAPDADDDPARVEDYKDELSAILGQTEAPALFIDDLLTGQDISDLFGRPSQPRRTPIPGLVPSPWHNGYRFFYDESRRGVFFELRQARSNTHMRQIYDQLQRSEHWEVKRVEIGDDGFWSTNGPTTRVVTMLEPSLTIVSITCDETQCHVPMILMMIRRIMARLNASY